MANINWRPSLLERMSMQQADRGSIKRKTKQVKPKKVKKAKEPTHKSFTVDPRKGMFFQEYGDLDINFIKNIQWHPVDGGYVSGIDVGNKDIIDKNEEWCDEWLKKVSEK